MTGASLVAVVALLAPALAVRSTSQLAEETKLAVSEGQAGRQSAVYDAAQEQDFLWDKILADENTCGKPPSPLSALKLMSVARDIPILGRLIKWAGITEDLNGTFDWRKDMPLPERPPPVHKKLIHPIGSVAKVSLVWDEDVVKKFGYTGVFAARQDHAFLRAGPAGPLKKDGMAPGIGLKVFRDYKESVNTVMLYSLRGQKGFSHFEHTLCNKLSDFRDKVWAEKMLLSSFKMASKYPFTTGLSQWAENEGNTTNFPFVMCLRPVDDVWKDFKSFNDKSFDHIQEQLGTLNAKKIIYDIYAASEPRTEPIKIGSVQLATKFRKTQFGDEELFFRHDRFENDLKLKPEWVSKVDDPDFWYEEGAANFYKSIDPGFESGEMADGQNAWVGGYNPKDQWEMSTHLTELVPNVKAAMLETDGGEYLTELQD